MTASQKESALQALRDVYSRCQACPICPRAGKTVLWEGKATAPLMLVGEAPGRVETELGRPFVGPAGAQVLDAMLAKAKLRRGIDVYITNVVKGWPQTEKPPGRTRTPTATEAQHCAREVLDKEIKIAQPKAILALGAVAAQYLMNSRLSIGRLRGHQGMYLGIPVVATYHPAYVLYLSGRSAPEQVRQVKWQMWDDLRLAMQLAGFPTQHMVPQVQPA